MSVMERASRKPSQSKLAQIELSPPQNVQKGSPSKAAASEEARIVLWADMVSL
jgi:hypothetical protein